MTVAKYVYNISRAADSATFTANFEFHVSTNSVNASTSPAVNLYMRWNKVPAS
ncbi:MAG: hypothetical protein PHP45_03145 [Elusimicrobiales bacterium]|nr:hypothetical protein [Elusimicrobiales bacterium]